MFLDVFWTLHDGAKVFGANVYGQELQWLFTKYTCCMLRICKWIWDVYGATSFFLDVHDVFDNWFDSFFNNKLKPTFSAKLRFAFFWKLHLVYNNFVEKNNVFGIYEKFERILECLWWIRHMWFHPNEMDNSLTVNGWDVFFRFPLPLPRRQSWNKSDTTQCMVHVKQTTLSFRLASGASQGLTYLAHSQLKWSCRMSRVSCQPRYFSTVV